MTQFTVKWKADKAARKLEAARAALLPDEEVWYLGFCNNMMPLASEIALTDLRVVALQDRLIKFEARYPDIASLTTDDKKGTVTILRQDFGSMTFKLVPKDDLAVIDHYFQQGRRNPTPAHAVGAGAGALGRVTTDGASVTTATGSAWPTTIVRGKLSRKANQAIQRQCHEGETPWLILTSSGGAGTLTAFDDRLVIIKTGGLTSFMAGSLGGERSATFHYADITGIEYNSGFINGVLEVLTASYNGSANKDFWRGSNQSRNADSNDPWTLSNCLPLSKQEYNSYLTELNQLKSRISKAKQINVQVVTSQVAPAPEGLAGQLQQLGALHAAGVLSDEEFTAAKARLLA